MGRKFLSSLSVFFPAYNDAKSIGKLVNDAFWILPKITNNYEVIVVNDGSQDDTQKVLEKLAKKFNKLRIITHEKNKGYGGALINGFKNTRYDYIFYTDGDGQYDVKEIMKLVEKMDGGIDLVNGYKIQRSDPVVRIVVGNLYALWVRLLLGIRFADVDCDFRLIRKKIMKNITLTRNSGAICAELLTKIQKASGVVASVPVNHYSRKFGNSQFFRPQRVIKTIFDDFWLWWNVK
ncbi:MAG: glycosyltransferase family 2 protein [bacterium]|nr:glycosyltransferase family 2 protein [bacterium]